METTGRRAHGKRIRTAAHACFRGAAQSPRFVRGRWIVVVHLAAGPQVFLARPEAGAVTFEGRTA